MQGPAGRAARRQSGRQPDEPRRLPTLPGRPSGGRPGHRRPPGAGRERQDRQGGARGSAGSGSGASGRPRPGSGSPYAGRDGGRRDGRSGSGSPYAGRDGGRRDGRSGSASPYAGRDGGRRDGRSGSGSAYAGGDGGRRDGPDRSGGSAPSGRSGAGRGAGGGASRSGAGFASRQAGARRQESSRSGSTVAGRARAGRGTAATGRVRVVRDTTVAGRARAGRGTPVAAPAATGLWPVRPGPGGGPVRGPIRGGMTGLPAARGETLVGGVRRHREVTVRARIHVGATWGGRPAGQEAAHRVRGRRAGRVRPPVERGTGPAEPRRPARAEAILGGIGIRRGRPALGNIRRSCSAPFLPRRPPAPEGLGERRPPGRSGGPGTVGQSGIRSVAGGGGSGSRRAVEPSRRRPGRDHAQEVWILDDIDDIDEPASARSSSPDPAASRVPHRHKVPGPVLEELTGAAGAGRGPKLAERLAEASHAYDRERYPEAFRLVRPLVDAASESAAVRELYGLTLYRMERWALAARELYAYAGHERLV